MLEDGHDASEGRLSEEERWDNGAGDRWTTWGGRCEWRHASECSQYHSGCRLGTFLQAWNLAWSQDRSRWFLLL